MEKVFSRCVQTSVILIMLYTLSISKGLDPVFHKLQKNESKNQEQGNKSSKSVAFYASVSAGVITGYIKHLGPGVSIGLEIKDKFLPKLSGKLY